MFNPEELARPNVQTLKSYECARGQEHSSRMTYLHANEFAADSCLSRYPDSAGTSLRAALAAQLKLTAGQVILGNGSDELIDMVLRAFCCPGKDAILTFPPTYGMYRVWADLNQVSVATVPLTREFQLDMPRVLQTLKTQEFKLVIACSPNNPTGNLIREVDLLQLAENKRVLLLVDEAYIDFAPHASLLPRLSEFPNLILLRTFSKARGLAGIRLGYALASSAIINILNRIRAPYNVGVPAMEYAIDQLKREEELERRIAAIVTARESLRQALNSLKNVRKVYPSDANFLLIEFEDAGSVYQHLLEQKIVVRDRREHVPGSLRISVGTEPEMTKLLTVLRELA